MRRAIIPLIAIAMLAFTGWGIMFTRGGQNPFPAATPTPSSGTTIDQCAAHLGTGVDLPLTLTVATNTDGSAEGLLLIHKGVTAGTDPNQTVLSSMDSFNNTWYNDLTPVQTGGINKASSGCLNADWVPVSSGTGSDTVTAKSPGTGLLNAAVLCTIKNFAAYDVSGGTPYPSPATQSQSNALTGTISPTIANELSAAMYYIDNGGPAATFTFSNLSSNSTITPGTPSDISFTGSSVSSSATAGQLIGATCEGSGASCGATSIAVGNSVGLQRSFSPTGNFCGGIIAFTNAISSLTISPTNPSVNAGATQQFTATAVLPSGGTQNVLTGGPVWTSSNTSVATISATGLASVSASAAANSTTTIAAAYKGKSASTTLTVIAAAAGTFPQFSKSQFSGHFLTTYTPGVSLWQRSWFGGCDPASGLCGRGGLTAANMKAAGINVMETPVYSDPVSGTNAGCNSTNFALFGGTSPCGTWDNWWTTNFWNPKVSWYRTNGIVMFDNHDGDNTQRGDTEQCSWGVPAINDYLAATNGAPLSGSAATVQPPGMVINAVGVDEAGGDGGSQTPGTCDLQALANFGVNSTNPHVPYGQEPFQGIRSGWATPAAADYIVWETTTDPGNANTGGSQVMAMLKSGLLMDNLVVNLNRPTTPSLLDTFPTGTYYFKASTTVGSDYQPGVDCNTGFGITTSNTPTNNSGASAPALALASEFFAVAHGYAGIRNYRYDAPGDDAGRKSSAAICTGMPTTTGTACITYGNSHACTLNQVGSAPPADFTSFGSLGADRWTAMAAANLLIQNTIEPYVLQPAMASPDSAAGWTGGACLTYQNTSTNYGVVTTPAGLVCGAKNGNGGRLVVIINFDEVNSRIFNFDPSPYFQGATVAQSWLFHSSTNHGCATSTYDSGFDCGVGPTSINGTQWAGIGNALPAPVVNLATTAPVSLTMQPLDVYVFLYHS